MCERDFTRLCCHRINRCLCVLGSDWALVLYLIIQGQSRVMDHLMKKSLSLGDISQQQAGSTRVTYTPMEGGIPEHADEPGSCPVILLQFYNAVCHIEQQYLTKLFHLP